MTDIKKINLNGTVYNIGSSSDNIPIDVKLAMDTLFSKMGVKDNDEYTTESGIIHDWATSVSLSSITAVFTQGQTTIYNTASLESLKQYLTVTANYSDGTSETVTTYTLSGKLNQATSTITVSYEGETATFNVAVTVLYLYKLSTSTISKTTGTAGGETNRQIYIATDNQKRRFFAVNTGDINLKQSSDDTNFTDSSYYPIPIPLDATSVTVTITPNTQYVGLYQCEIENSVIIRKRESGWVQNTTTWSLDSGNDRVLCIISKYDSAGGTYYTEPTELVVQFATT